MTRWFALCLAIMTAPLGAQQTTEQAAANAPGVFLRGLDKVAGQTVDVEIPVGGMAEVFGLSVAVQECRYPPENPTGEAFALISIQDQTSGTVAFQGWMSASAPALNPLDHRRYDVWVMRCSGLGDSTATE